MNIEKEKPDEFKAWGEMYALHKKYYSPKTQDEFEEMVNEITNAIEKYKDTDFGFLNHDLLRCLIDDADRKIRGKSLKWDFERSCKEAESIGIENFRQKLMGYRGKTVDEVLAEIPPRRI